MDKIRFQATLEAVSSIPNFARIINRINADVTQITNILTNSHAVLWSYEKTTII
jgi:hypothetical protein